MYIYTNVHIYKCTHIQMYTYTNVTKTAPKPYQPPPPAESRRAANSKGKQRASGKQRERRNVAEWSKRRCLPTGRGRRLRNEAKFLRTMRLCRLPSACPCAFAALRLSAGGGNTTPLQPSTPPSPIKQDRL